MADVVPIFNDSVRKVGCVIGYNLGAECLLMDSTVKNQWHSRSKVFHFADDSPNNTFQTAHFHKLFINSKVLSKPRINMRLDYEFLQRKEVLQNFKKLHRTRLKVFHGDEKALSAARLKINEEYKKNKLVTEEESIRAMIKFGEEVERELKTQVIQAREIKPGVFEAKITEDTVKLENIPFNSNAIPDDGKNTPTSCCKDEARYN